MRIVHRIFQNDTSFLFSSLSIKTGHSFACNTAIIPSYALTLLPQANGQRASAVKISKRLNKLPLLAEERQKRGNSTLEKCSNVKEAKDRCCLLMKTVSVSWADQGVESEAWQTFRPTFDTKPFSSLGLLGYQLTNDPSASPFLGTTPCFMAWSGRVALPVTSPTTRKTKWKRLLFSPHFFKYPHSYLAKGIETN